MPQVLHGILLIYAHPDDESFWGAGSEGGDPAAHAGVDLIIDTSSVRTRRAEALRSHRTQFAGINRLFLGRGDVDDVLGREMFRQAWGPSLPTIPGGDLFGGIAKKGDSHT